MEEAKRTDSGGLQAPTQLEQPAALQPASPTCSGSCPGAAAAAMPYAVPMVTGIGSVIDMTKEPAAPSPTRYAVPADTSIGPVVDMTRPQILKPLADGAVTRVVDGTAFVDLTQPRVVDVGAAPAVAGSVVPGMDADVLGTPNGQAQPLALIGEENYEPVLDTTAYPQRTVVKIGAGTGIMIGNRTVLTCAHALLQGNGDPLESIHVVPALANVDMPYGDAWVALVLFDPELAEPLKAAKRKYDVGWIGSKEKPLPPMEDPECIRHDFAIAILDRSLGLRCGHAEPSETLWENAQEPSRCADTYPIESYGYPDAARGCPGAQCPHAGDLPSYQQYRVTGSTFPLAEGAGSGGTTTCTWLADGPERVRFKFDVLGGQSGSPVLLQAPPQGLPGLGQAVAVVTHGGGSPEPEPPTVGNSGTLVNGRRVQFLDKERWRDDLLSDFDEMRSEGWTLLYGGESLRLPTVVAYNDSRLDVLVCTSSGRLIWRRYDGQTWNGPYDLQMQVSHSPSATVRPNGEVHIAARRPNGRVVVGTLHADTKSCDWVNLSADALDAPTIVATSQDGVQLFFLTNNPSWSWQKDTPRRTVRWYKGSFGGTSGAWHNQGVLGACAPGESRSIRSRVAALAVDSSHVALAGIDVIGRLVWRFLYLGTGLMPGVVTPWIASDAQGFEPLIGTPRLVQTAGGVTAVVRYLAAPIETPLGEGGAYRIELDPVARSANWTKRPFPAGASGSSQPISGEVAACIHRRIGFGGYINRNLVVFGRASQPRSERHGTVLGTITSQLGHITEFPNEGGRMIDVQTAVLANELWLVARGYDLNTYFRVINL